MATVALLSAKGSPGVTTSTLAMAFAWPTATARSVVVFDADPVGGDTAPGILGGGVVPATGALALAAMRSTDPVAAVESCSVPLDEAGRVRLLPGVPDSSRAGALSLAWDHIAEVGEQFDVLVDAGRVDVADPIPAWPVESDLMLLAVRPNLRSIAAAHRLVAGWPEVQTRLAALVIEEPGPYSAAQAAGAVGLPMLGTIPFDPQRARVYSDGARAKRDHSRSGYVRQVLACAAKACQEAARNGLKAEVSHG